MILSLLFFACVGDTQEPDLENPILNTHFTFHQDVNKLYFGLETETVYNDQQLSSVSVLWFGKFGENILSLLLNNRVNINVSISQNNCRIQIVGNLFGGCLTVKN